MTKAELIDKVIGDVGSDKLTKKLTEELIEATFEAMKDALLKEGRFSYPSFGTFTVKERATRKGRNPQTGQEIEIPASKTVSFKPAPKFKESLK
ncbi:MAG: HU family DNA-binding protein [Myxococcales bacterium]|nr:HU family DNA-binding protein [Myxococcales bacterium]MCB9644311.1 HU family DNA-binding protein [Myxococcales bacterium]